MYTKGLKYIFSLVLVLAYFSQSLAQVERKVSLNTFIGLSFFAQNEKRNAVDLPTKIFAGYHAAPTFGIGLNYKLSKRFSAGENLFFLTTAKPNFNFSLATLRTSLKYYILTDNKLNPYVLGGINVSFAFLNRAENQRTVTLDSTINTIGQGFQGTQVKYNDEALNLSFMPMIGTSIGAGVDFKLSKKINLFLEYTINGNLAKSNQVLQNDYSYNNSNLSYQSITAGITLKLFRPQKQLLATLKPDDWLNNKPIDVKGTIIYKKPPKTYKKVLEIERTDTLENVIEIHPTDANGLIFFSKNLEIGNYQFMLAKRKRKIIRADLQILNYNRIEIADEELELEMVEDENSENILSRDANFSVLLREGFQHEVDLTTIAENIMGKLTPKDTNCKVRIILKDMKDSVIAQIDTLDDGGTFNFVNVTPGKYKMVYQKLNNTCKDTRFDYNYTGATPYITKQYNSDIPKDTTPVYKIDGKISTNSGTPQGMVVKLIDPSGRVETNTKLGQSGTFNYNNLNSPDFTAVYEDPAEKSKIDYNVKNNKEKIIKQYSHTYGKKPAKEGKVNVTGKVETPNNKDNAAITVLLVDSLGKIRQKVPLSSDGTFAFNKLPKNQYKVVYESKDPLVRGKLQYNVSDNSIARIKLPDMFTTAELTDTIHLTKQGVDVPTNTDTTGSVIKENKNTPVTIIDPVKKPVEVKKKKEVPVAIPFAKFEPGKTYNDYGFEVIPEGYGVQISSFIINTNLEKFCQRIRAKGEKNIFIQVIQKDKNNPEAGLIYRAIIGANTDKEKVLKLIPKYIDKGYDAVLRKHLTPTAGF